eukprot:gene10774-11927_t
METDEDSKDSNISTASLRRWNSSPMISVIKSEKHSAFDRPAQTRSRTYSASMYSSTEVDVEKPNHINTPIGSPASRVIQLKQEESIDEMTREVLSERNVTSEIQLSQSWGEMSLLAEKSFSMAEDKKQTNDEVGSAFSSPVASPSPNRLSNDQRLSRARSLTPSPGPLPISPRCRTIRRSLSPSGLRPSAFTSKRKIETDDMDITITPSKRIFNHHTLSTSSASTCSSPDIHFDSSAHLSFDDDSGSDNSYPGTSAPSSSMSPIAVSNPNSFFYDSKHSQAFSFLKPRYVAPPSPLAAGVHSASINQSESKKNTFATNNPNYSFTPVKD